MLYGWLIDERMTIRQILKRLNAGPYLPALGPPSLVAVGRAPHPRRSGLRRHRLRQPLRLRARQEAAARPRPAQPRTLVPPAQAARAVDRHPRAGAGRRGHLGPGAGAARAQRRALVPQQQQAQLPAALPADLQDLRPRHVRRHPPRRPRASRSGATTSATARTASCRARPTACPSRNIKAEELEAAVWDHVAGLLADPRRLLAQFEHLAATAEAGTRPRPRRRSAAPRSPGPHRPSRQAPARRLPGRRDQPGRVVRAAFRTSPRSDAGLERQQQERDRLRQQRTAGRGGAHQPGGLLRARRHPPRRGDIRRQAGDLAAGDRAHHRRRRQPGDPPCHSTATQTAKRQRGVRL